MILKEATVSEQSTSVPGRLERRLLGSDGRGDCGIVLLEGSMVIDREWGCGLDLCEVRGMLCESGTIREKRGEMREPFGRVVLVTSVVDERSSYVQDNGSRKRNRVMLEESVT